MEKEWMCTCGNKNLFSSKKCDCGISVEENKTNEMMRSKVDGQKEEKLRYVFNLLDCKRTRIKRNLYNMKYLLEFLSRKFGIAQTYTNCANDVDQHLFKLNNLFLRLPVVGLISSGKTTLVNCFVLRDVMLPSSSLQNTTVVCILKHWDEEEPALFKCVDEEKIMLGDSSFFFRADGEPIRKGKDDIRKYLEEANSKPDGGFFIIKCKMGVLSNIDKQTRNMVEIIDIPGIDSKDRIFNLQNVLKRMFVQRSSVVFVTDPGKLSTKETQSTMEKLQEFVKLYGLEDFDAEESLFVLKKFDELTTQDEINKGKGEMIAIGKSLCKSAKVVTDSCKSSDFLFDSYLNKKASQANKVKENWKGTEKQPP